MTQTKLLCVDCYDVLQSVVLEHLTIFYCHNHKCRRFGVLTLGGLQDAVCEKSIVIEKDDSEVEEG